MYIELKQLSKSFGGKMVVDHLNLSLEKGKILCLLGSSGCGKTTTLRMVGGFLESSGGTVIVDGQDITGMLPEKRPVSTVFQSYALFPHKTVIENVIYGLKFQGLKKREALEKGREYLKIVGLSEYENARIHELSGGQQQRVALARALVVNPKVLLLDEPLSNLDAKLRVRMRDEIRQLQQKLGMTMIFVTHDQEEAMVLADTIAIMNEGRLVQTGTPEEVYHHPADQFVMNFLGIANRIALPDGEVIYVRPEAISFARAGDLKAGDLKVGDWKEGNSREDGLTKGELKGRVVKREFLGFYCQYQVDLGADRIVVRAAPETMYREGDEVTLKVRRESRLLT